MSRTREATTSAGAAVIVLVLAACGGTGEQEATTPSATLSATATTSTTPGASASSDHHDRADVEFLQGMVPHHSQAIEMSDIILAKAGVDDRVKALAKQIKAAQEPEIQHMNGLLHDWGEDVPASEDSSSHGMDHSGGAMNGMMSDQDLQALRNADDAEATRLYLQQMVQHHQGAVQMAQTELRNGENPDAKQLAQSIIDSQQAEIEHMKSLLGSL